MFLEHAVYWHWFIAGLALLVLEMLIPANLVLLWMGISAMIVGLLMWAFPMPWPGQLVLFAMLSLASFFAYRRWRPQETASDAPTLNRRGESYVGRTFSLTSPIINGVGTLKVDDSQWRVAGPDLPEGSRVRIVKAEGATLRVERDT